MGFANQCGRPLYVDQRHYEKPLYRLKIVARSRKLHGDDDRVHRFLQITGVIVMLVGTMMTVAAIWFVRPFLLLSGQGTTHAIAR